MKPAKVLDKPKLPKLLKPIGFGSLKTKGKDGRYFRRVLRKIRKSIPTL